MSQAQLLNGGIRLFYQLTQEEIVNNALTTLKTCQRKELGFSTITVLYLQKIVRVYILSTEIIRNFDPAEKAFRNSEPDHLTVLKVENET